MMYSMRGLVAGQLTPMEMTGSVRRFQLSTRTGESPTLSLNPGSNVRRLCHRQSKSASIPTGERIAKECDHQEPCRIFCALPLTTGPGAGRVLD